MSNRLKFLASFAQIKADGAFNALIQLAVKFDPEGATEAQIKMMESKLDEFGGKIAQLETQLVQEQREYDDAKAAFDQLVAAAEIMQTGLQANPNDPDKASKEAGLMDLIAQAEAMKPEVADELADVNDVKSLIADLSQAHKELGKKIVNARQNMQRAQRTVERNTRAAERAESAANAQAEKAGIRKSTETLDVALNAMNNIAQQATERARSAQLKTESLKGAEPSSNPHVAAALAQAKGSVPPVAQQSAADRLSALKAGSAQKAA